jgi:hypothetical protein
VLPTSGGLKRVQCQLNRHSFEVALAGSGEALLTRQIVLRARPTNSESILTIPFSLITGVVAKEITREQAERKKAQAASFMDRIGQPDRAEEFEQMSTDEYAEHKGLHLSNPRIRRRTVMANGNTTTKADLQDVIDSAIDILDDAYQVESTREDLAEAINSTLDTLRGESEDDETSGDVDEDDDPSLD